MRNALIFAHGALFTERFVVRSVLPSAAVQRGIAVATSCSSPSISSCSWALRGYLTWVTASWLPFMVYLFVVTYLGYYLDPHLRVQQGLFTCTWTTLSTPSPTGLTSSSSWAYTLLLPRPPGYVGGVDGCAPYATKTIYYLTMLFAMAAFFVSVL